MAAHSLALNRVSLALVFLAFFAISFAVEWCFFFFWLVSRLTVASLCGGAPASTVFVISSSLRRRFCFAFILASPVANVAIRFPPKKQTIQTKQKNTDLFIFSSSFNWILRPNRVSAFFDARPITISHSVPRDTQRETKKKGRHLATPSSVPQ